MSGGWNSPPPLSAASFQDPYNAYSNSAGSSFIGDGSNPYYPSQESDGGGVYYGQQHESQLEYDLAQNHQYYYSSQARSPHSSFPVMAEEQQTSTTQDLQPGSLYQVESFQPFMSTFNQPSSLPVSSLAYDDTYNAVFCASHTHTWSASSSHRKIHGSSPTRASWLVAHALPSRHTGTIMLYSSMAGHPEATSPILRSVYQTLYNCSQSAPSSTQANQSRRKIPAHAFRPPFGDRELDPSMTASNPVLLNPYHMGILDLLPLGQGYVASVSPACVRIHSHGGLSIAQSLQNAGMLALAPHPQHHSHHHGATTSSLTHLTVGGMALSQEQIDKSSKLDGSSVCQGGKNQIMCLDLWQGLRVVASYSTSRGKSSSLAMSTKPVAVTALATSQARGQVIAGCSDGQIRLLDGRVRELAQVKTHLGGVVDLATSGDGNLLATTGYSSQGTPNGSSMYAFADPNVYVYDLRYLGRGGLPHPFAGLHGGPRRLVFLPPSQDSEHSGSPYSGSSSSNRLLVASGQVGGGMQIMIPFEETDSSSSNFLSPQLSRGEAMTCLTVHEDVVGVGTTKGNVMQFRIAGSKKASDGVTLTGRGQPLNQSTTRGIFASSFSSQSSHSNIRGSGKKELRLPSFEPSLPALSIDASLLIKNETSASRRGMSDQIKSIFSSYTMNANPSISKLGPMGNEDHSTFGNLCSVPIVNASRNDVGEDFLGKATHAVDFLRTAKLDLDVLQDHRPDSVKSRIRKRMDPLANPNKFIFSSKMHSLVYVKSFNRAKRAGRKNHRITGSDGDQPGHLLFDIPSRYRLSIRPTHKSAAVFSHAEYNGTGLFPGWDYPPTMPNAFVPPVLMLLYFIPQVRTALLNSQPTDNRSAILAKEKGIKNEISILFHRIDCLSRFAMIFPGSNGMSASAATAIAKLGAWAPSNFVSSLMAMPEAEQLQILDGSPAAVETPRRPEAFYRFLLYQIDKEFSKGPFSRTVDNLAGIDFVSVNEFISGSGPPTTSSTRALTVELYYEPFIVRGAEAPSTAPSFGAVLEQTLSRETRLRAFNKASNAYETIVQRKIAISLPTLLSLSCACAGRKEEEGLFAWRGHGITEDHWLPERINVEVTEKGNILVRELVQDQRTGKEEWKIHGNDNSISTAVASVLKKRKERRSQSMEYELFAVISMIRDDLDRNFPEEIASAAEENCGHHMLHVRVPRNFTERMRRMQIEELETLLSQSLNPMAVVGSQDRDSLEERLKRSMDVDKCDEETSWVLINGFNVSSTSVEDARAFHMRYKEPCIVLFRCLEDKTELGVDDPQTKILLADVLATRSITNGAKSAFAGNIRPHSLKAGDLIAFDAEFVSVQEEVSTLSESGSKVTIQETRHAIARISAFACDTQAVLFDDYVLPQEPVADYLTRFSGIMEKDLHPKESQHHLISTRAAYLKLRYLVERGCVFVGHGLQRDFWTAGVVVPNHQIIDTVEIYHKPARRYISLRFLTNYVLKRDMQQEVHDSLEDATAAFELYKKAIELEQRGEFSTYLDGIYQYGLEVDWKLGVE